MRRILQSKGAEIIHLGHNRSVHEIVECAIEEDAHGIAITSYQGGHVEFFKYMKDLLDEAKCGHIGIFGGGGGTILPAEIEELHRYGIKKIYTPDDGRSMGLEGMIEDVIKQCNTDLPEMSWNGQLPLGEVKDIRKIARAITEAENGMVHPRTASGGPPPPAGDTKLSPSPVIGLTGTGGSGKSSVTDEIVRRFLNDSDNVTIAVISVDPSKKKTGGALLGDRIRMNSISHPRVYMRSLATRDDNTALSAYVKEAINICKSAGYEIIILESAGIGQSDTAIINFCDVSIYVMTPEYGAASQLEKINMLDYADLIAVNKSDKPGAKDALLDVKKQYKRNHALFTAKDDQLPVLGTIASQFNDPGINDLYAQLIAILSSKINYQFVKNRTDDHELPDEPAPIIPPKRVRYLSEIAENNRAYDKWVSEQASIASDLYKLEGAKKILTQQGNESAAASIDTANLQLDAENKKLLDNWKSLGEKYSASQFSYAVRGKIVNRQLTCKSLSGTTIRKVILPKYSDWGDILKWQLQENVPGSFPYTAGVYSLKRDDEDPTRMFAGEGGPERTNKRFHYLSDGQPAIRLSTAFDSVTLYGEDPDERPDIFGKIGNAGVSVATLDDAKKLYKGIDLSDPKTSVSMTINGPAPVMLAFFLNTAIDQQVEKHLLGTKTDTIDAVTYQKIKSATLTQVRGTVQADILKEDQAQNTCIFSTEFALKLMGDVQQYFIDNDIRNFYSVSISGYHIAEAGANPVTQLAFTLANGFTYLEYFLSRGMHIDDFAPNLSFFFSNGMDPEYSVIGRVARRIWAKALKHLYKGNERSQKLKYHIQTSGRSLHAQEIDFNDIRTTLQALYAIYDNCNSLHTNAYDEAITTPTEESVRRAMAIQLIINRELGTAKNENPNQGSFLIEELTDLVEEAVLAEFDRLTERGGVLGAMERMYQRNKIQEESLHYESMKHSGDLPIVGVNTFLDKKGSPTLLPGEVIRSTEQEKIKQIENLRAFKKRNESRSADALKKLQHVAVKNENIFTELMETVKYCSLGQITHALYEVGGQYRRSM